MGTADRGVPTRWSSTAPAKHCDVESVVPRRNPPVLGSTGNLDPGVSLDQLGGLMKKTSLPRRRQPKVAHVEALTVPTLALVVSLAGSPGVGAVGCSCQECPARGGDLDARLDGDRERVVRDRQHAGRGVQAHEWRSLRRHHCDELCGRVRNRDDPTERGASAVFLRIVPGAKSDNGPAITFSPSGQLWIAWTQKGSKAVHACPPLRPRRAQLTSLRSHPTGPSARPEYER